MTREEYKKYLLSLLNDDEYLVHDGDIKHAIYMIDDVVIGGDFTSGYRANDHNVIKHDDISWIDIIKFGIVIVPETKSYISDVKNPLFDSIGYQMTNTNNNNHIVGYKGE